MTITMFIAIAAAINIIMIIMMMTTTTITPIATTIASTAPTS